MKVFINNIIGITGGQVTRVRGLNLCSPEFREKCTVFCFSHDPSLKPDIVQKIIRIPLLSPALVSLIFEFFFLWFYLYGSNCSKNTYINFSNFSFPIGCNCKKLLGVTNALIFEKINGVKSRKYRTLNMLFYASQYFIDRNIFLSNHCLTLATENKSNIKPAVVIHNGVSDFWHEKKWRVTATVKDKVRLLYVSHGYYYKNHKFLLNYVHKLKQELDTEVELILVGRFSKDFQIVLKAYARDLNICDEITFQGECCSEEVRNLLFKSRFVIYPSEVENCPNALLEAGVTGITCLVPNKEPYREFKMENFRFFEANNVEDAVHCTIKYLSERPVDKINTHTKKQQSVLTWPQFWTSLVDRGF